MPTLPTRRKGEERTWSPQHLAARAHTQAWPLLPVPRTPGLGCPLHSSASGPQPCPTAPALPAWGSPASAKSLAHQSHLLAGCGPRALGGHRAGTPALRVSPALGPFPLPLVLPRALGKLRPVRRLCSTWHQVQPVLPLPSPGIRPLQRTFPFVTPAAPPSSCGPGQGCRDKPVPPHSLPEATVPGM